MQIGRGFAQVVHASRPLSTGYDAYAMGMPLHSHRDIHIIMPLMVIVIGQVIHRHRYASTHSFVFSLVSEIDVVRLGIALFQCLT